MEFVKGSGEFAVEILKALGIDPGMTRRLVIDIPCDDIVKIYVEGFANNGAMQAAVEQVQKNAGRIKVEELNPDASIYVDANGIMVRR